MDASTYYEMHKIIERIARLVRHEMYKGERTGTIPPEAIAEVADEIRMQVTWLDMAEGIHDDEEPPNRVYPPGHPDRVSDEAVNAANSYHLTTEDCEPPAGEPDW